MKRFISLFMCLVMIFALSSCGKSTATGDAGTTSGNVNSKDVTSGELGTGSKSLIVYFSATGSTKRVAEYISNAVGGTLFELVPTEAYDSDDLNYNNKDSRVCYEHDNPDKRDVELESTTVDNFSDYDTIFIGYPIWWGIAAWPVDTFVKANDFSGKTVIPFCTSASSGLGNSGKELEKMAGTGTWLEGKRFSSGASESDVTEWVNTLEVK